MILGRGIGRVTRLLLQIVIARLLGPDDFGAFAVAWSAILIAQKSVLLGADRVGIRFGGILLEQGARAERSRFVALLLATAGVLGAAVGIAVSAEASTVADVLALSGTGRLVAVLGLGLPLLTLHLTLTGLVRGAHRPGSEALWSEVLTPALNIALLFLLPPMLSGWTLIEVVALAFVLSHALPALGMAGRVARDYLRADPDARPARVLPDGRAVATFALGVSTVGILGVLLARVDRVLVAPFLTSEAVGLYAAAVLIAQQNAFFLQSVATAAGPRFALLERGGRTAELRETAAIVERWTAIASMPVVLLTIFLAPDLLGLMGPEFRAGWPLLVILSTVQAVNVTTGTSGALLNMTGSERFNVRALGAGLALLVVLLPVGAVLAGGRGAALGTGIAWATLWAIQRRAMAARVGVPFPSFGAAELLLPTAGAIGAGLAVVLLVEAPLPRAALVVVLLPSVYVVIAWSRMRSAR